MHRQAAAIALALAASAWAQTGTVVRLPNTWIAVRYDATHVQIILEGFSGENPELGEMLRPRTPPAPEAGNVPEAICAPYCFFPVAWNGAEQFDGFVRQQAPVGELPPSLPRPGESYRVQLGTGQAITASVNDYLGAYGADGYFLGVLATVGAGDLDSFHAAPTRVFVATPAGENESVRGPSLSPWHERAAQSAFEALLNQHLAEFVATARAGLDKLLGVPEPPKVPPAQDARLKRLLGGEGKLDAEFTRVTLASGDDRFYVRAEWLVDGKATFAIAAWLADPAEPRLLSWDTENAARTLLGAEIALEQPGSGKRIFPKLLSVAALGDGRTAIVFEYRGYESFEIKLLLYDDAGPQPTAVVSYGDGG